MTIRIVCEEFRRRNNLILLNGVTFTAPATGNKKQTDPLTTKS